MNGAARVTETLESFTRIRQTGGVRLDRLLDSVGLDIVPFAICDVRRGVRVELAPFEDAHVYYVLRGDGAMQTKEGYEVGLGPATLAIVPAGVVHLFEPTGGSTRLVSIQPVGTSNHVPTVIAGGGEPGLLLIGGHVRSADRNTPALFETLAAPLALDLSDTVYAPGLFAALSDELERGLPGNCHMMRLLMQQCLLHVLRRLPWLWAPDAGDYPRSAQDTGIELKAPRTAQ